MKILIIYYSYDDNSRFIAEQLQNVIGADILRIETVDNKKRKGLAKFFWGGKQVFAHLKPELKPYTVDIDAYDFIILGGPVWAASPAPALESFISQTPIKDKRIALFVCHAGGKGDVFEKLKSRLAGNIFVGEADFQNPLKGDPAAVAESIRQWAKTLG
jgi:flavodoxin